MYIHALIIFPLCLQKNLDALKYTSILGIIGIAYCAVFMTYRLFDGTYLPGGAFFNTLAPAFKPSFNKLGARVDSKLFVLISMISTAYVAHYNAPKFWTSLKNKTPERYNTMVSLGFAFSFIMYMIVMWSGFLTFGGNSTGFILNNYSSKDNLATIARFAIGAGILCGYPLTFTALRDGIMDLMKVPDNKRDSLIFPLTAAVCSVLTGCALVLKNVGLVVAFSGALIGAMLIYFVPAVMNIKNMPLHITLSSPGKGKGRNPVVVTHSSSAQKMELLINYFMAFMGVAIACVGGYTTLKGASGH
jgi:sodium-coupled neutral amino acid transporter 11